MNWILFGELFAALARATQREGVQPAIPTWLEQISVMLTQGGASVHEIKNLERHILKMVAENREPTADEWAKLKARSDKSHQIIQNADLSE